MIKPIRLRDFIEDEDGWLYAVAAYDNDDRVGCVLRYIPDSYGERTDRSGKRYRKIDFGEAYRLVSIRKPDYTGTIHRVPVAHVRRILKPEELARYVCSRDPRVGRLAQILCLRQGEYGCTGSLLCGLEAPSSDIDLVVYGKHWYEARSRLRDAIGQGLFEDITDAMWQRIYEKRKPAITLAEFICHERRKINRGQIGGTYFDLLYTRSYEEISRIPVSKGRVMGTRTIRAMVTDASLSFDHPAVYYVDHPGISRVLSFTHTYAGQVLAGEELEACGICEWHGDEHWLVVGTSREAPGEYIKSLTLLGEESR